jgi:sulfhydrogenase subunit delta
MDTPKKKLAVWKLTSCDGCQLVLLDCEDELLAVADVFDIDRFPEASSRRGQAPWDISLVEGSVSRPDHVRMLHEIRRSSRTLVTIGACACAGGIQALRNMADIPALAAAVYPEPEWLGALLVSSPVSDHVGVDLELRGCPVDQAALLEVLAALAIGRRPPTRDHSVCLECKQAGHVCVTVAAGLPCLGPVIHGGCGALCPGMRRGCYGCFGPRASKSSAALATGLLGVGHRAGPVDAAMAACRAWAGEPGGGDHG